MNSFLSRMTHNNVRGENGMPAHSTTDSKVLDLFTLLGTRPTPEQLGPMLTRAYGENPELTLKALFHSRDVRGGKGERDSFRMAIYDIALQRPDDLRNLVQYIPEYGRWDDLHTLFGTPLQAEALLTIRNGLAAGNRLTAKWTPRKGEIANEIRHYLRLSPRSYRKMLVNGTKVVESQMCANEWEAINFSHVPSNASKIYAKAFNRHTPEKYQMWREALKTGNDGAKINVGTLYPHEIVQEARKDGDYPFEEAWTKLQETFPAFEEKILPVCDVSGSMNGLPMDVSVSLGLFFSQRNTGPFKDCFVTFSAQPKLQKLTGNLKSRLRQLETAHWDMNTDLIAVYNLIGQAAAKSAPEDMPTTILILSDMQFDQAVEWGKGYNMAGGNAMQELDKRFAAIGRQRPKVVFWNLRPEGAKTQPVKQHESGAALLSGFSPAVLRAVVNNRLESFTPYNVMLETLNAERYAPIRLQ